MQNHRPTTSRIRQTNRISQHFWQAFGFGHYYRLLAYRFKQRNLIEFLKRITSLVLARNHAGNRHQRRISQMCFSHTRHQVGNPGARLCTKYNTRAAVNSCIGIGHMRRGTLVSRTDITNAVIHINRIKKLEHRATQQTEYVFDLIRFQYFEYCLSTVYFHLFNLSCNNQAFINRLLRATWYHAIANTSKIYTQFI